MLNWNAIGAVGEILGAIAVLASLIYLAGQVRASTRFARSEAETEFQVRWNAMFDGLAGSVDRASVFRRGLHGLAHLSPDERVTLLNALGKMVDVQRIGMRMHEKGLLDHDLYEAGNNAVASILRSPGGREFWAQMRDFYDGARGCSPVLRTPVAFVRSSC
jgi:hypothetical protein